MEGDLQLPACARHMPSAGEPGDRPCPFLLLPRPPGQSCVSSSLPQPTPALVSADREVVSGAHPERHALGLWSSRDGGPLDWAAASSCQVDRAAAEPVRRPGLGELRSCGPRPAPGKGVTCWCQTHQKGVWQQGVTSRPRALSVPAQPRLAPDLCFLTPPPPPPPTQPRLHG